MERRVAAEVVGTFVLVFGGCGSAVLAGSYIGVHGVAVAFGLTVLAMAFAVGHISGGHFNPAVTLGLAVAKRFEWRNLPAYVVAQCLGAIAAIGVIALVHQSNPSGFSLEQGSVASNAFGQENGRMFFDAGGAAIAEVVLTAVFLIVILGVTTRAASKGFGPLAIGLTLTLIHLISIPITNTSVNPARSLGPALFEGGTALAQLWFFIVFPLVGAVIGAVVWALATGGDATQTGETQAQGIDQAQA